MIRFGVCTNFEKLNDLFEAGYDFIEANLSQVAAMSEEEFAKTVETIRISPLKAETFNGFFPANILIVGKQVDMDAIAAYTDKALCRAAKLGGKVAVLGSSRSRSIPECFPRETAYAQFCAVFDLCSTIADKYGMSVALEPLRSSECNFINTVAEGLDICRQVNNPHGKCLADFFHVYQSGESLDDIRFSDGWIIHTHLAAPDRNMPASEADIALCRQWAQALKDCGYDGRLSLEGRFAPDYAADITRTRKVLDLFNET